MSGEDMGQATNNQFEKEYTVKFIKLPVNFFEDPRIIKLKHMAGDDALLAFIRLCFKDKPFLEEVYNHYPVQEFIAHKLYYLRENQESLIDIFKDLDLISFEDCAVKINFNLVD